MKTMIFKLTEKQHMELKIYGVLTGQTVQSIIEQALKMYMKANPPKVK